ncbi:MAG: thioesterase family protein [Candidatus Binatia bacterium]|nr:thioesterase family protein [Candidatus Binatia bacterium]
MSDSERSPISALIGRLEVEALDSDLFLGKQAKGEGRLFGGFVAAQATVAAGRTVEDSHLHSLHAYFLRPGSYGKPIRYVVDRIRDGRTYTTRRVVALQNGEAIFNLSASFTKPEGGISHQDPIPDVPPPDDLPDWEDLREERMGVRGGQAALEVRPCDPDDEFRPGVPRIARRRIWMRPNGVVPDDPILHAAMFVYASDRTLLSTAGLPHGLVMGRMVGASLDHAMHLHRPELFEGWILYAAESPAAHGARGLTRGAMYSQAGIRIASVTQEGLIREPKAD